MLRPPVHHVATRSFSGRTTHQLQHLLLQGRLPLTPCTNPSRPMSVLPGATTSAAAQPPAASARPMPGRQLLSVAPMMDWTDIHYRQLARLISKRTWLWTEMVVDKTILHTPFLDNFLWFPPEQHPLVCQLGGSDPETLAAATRKVAEYGYDEINLNCGCPSDRVAGAGCFGASLMLQPELVAACMKAMAEASNGIPVTVKCRLGVDEVDSYEMLQHFVRVVSEGSPVRHFIVHARKCFLKGLNPHQNRTVPPLRHEWVYSLRHDFPHLIFSLNGGVQSCHEANAAVMYQGPWPTPGQVEDRGPEQQQQQQQQPPAAAEQHDASASPSGRCCDGDAGAALRPGPMQPAPSASPGSGAAPCAAPAAGLGPGPGPGEIEGVMIGRAAYNDPWGCLGDADRAVFGEPSNAARSRREVLDRYMEYAESNVYRAYGIKPEGYKDPSVRTLVKPLLGLFHGEPGSKRWKAALDTALKQDPASVRQVLEATLHHIPDEVLDAAPGAQLAPPPRCSFGALAKPEDRAGFSQTLTALKRAALKDGAQPQSNKRAGPERQAAKQPLPEERVALPAAVPMCAV